MSQMQVLNDVEINALQMELTKNIPSSIQALCFLKSVLNWKEKRRDLIWSVLSPDGDFTDCTFIVLVEIFDLLLGTLYSSTEEGSSKLKEGLISCNKIPWHMQFYFIAIPERILHIMPEIMSSKGVKFIREANTTYWLPPQNVLKFEVKPCPEVHLLNLTKTDAVKMSEVWSHKNSKSVQLMEEIINVNFGVGAYLKENNELVSWGIHWFYGGLAVVHTSEEHRGKGYAILVVTEIIKRLISNDWPVFLIVLENNHRGHTFFKKLGFEPAFKSYLHYSICD